MHSINERILTIKLISKIYRHPEYARKLGLSIEDKIKNDTQEQKAMVIYTTNEWRGCGRSYFWNEYRLEGNEIKQYRCGREKLDGEEEWARCESLAATWKKDDAKLPEWLRQHIKY